MTTYFSWHEEHFSSLQEEVEVKTKKLKKLWAKFQGAVREAQDLQEEFQVRTQATLSGSAIMMINSVIFITTETLIMIVLVMPLTIILILEIAVVTTPLLLSYYI